MSLRNPGTSMSSFRGELLGGQGAARDRKNHTNGFIYKALFGAVFDIALVFTFPSVT